MEISLYKFLFAIALVIFAISLFYIKDLELKIILNIISFILFAACTLQSLNIELYVYDGYEWQTQRITDYYLPLGTSFIFTLFSGIFTFDSALQLFWKPFQKQSNRKKYQRNY